MLLQKKLCLFAGLLLSSLINTNAHFSSKSQCLQDSISYESCKDVNGSGFALSETKLWYKQPAARWMRQALPIGNGKLGAMVFGGIVDERIQFNEKSMWTGKVNENENTDLMAAIPLINKLLLQGNIPKADSIYKQAGYLKYNGATSRVDFGAYQPFGDVKIHFRNQNGRVENYRRELNLETGIAAVQYSVNGVKYSRSYFCSYPDKVMVIHLSASKRGKLSVDVEDIIPELKDGKITINNQNDIVYSGTMADSGLKYEAHLRIISKTPKSVSGKTVSVNDATEITLLLAANTNYQMQYPNVLTDINPTETTANQLIAATEIGYSKLLKRHINDYSALFSTVKLILPTNKSNSQLPTDLRLRNYAENNININNGADNGLESLLFNYGRYLLISSSRGENLPANLQGIWNDKPNPPWDSDYHTDINLQMNYWPAGSTNLSTCISPLVKYLNFLRVPGSLTAKMYFNTNGFFVQLYTNIWGYAAPRWLWTGSAGWLCQNLYEQFLFSGNYQYLKTDAYPIMKDACRFYLGVLRPYKDGLLVVTPSVSPEINFIYTDGKDYRNSVGAAIDQQIVTDLFSNTIEAANILKVDIAFADSLSLRLNKLSNPMKIAPDGTIQEWIEPWKAVDSTHRHLSHLYGAFPGRLVHPTDNPTLATAVGKTILKRGYGFTEWATTWRMLLWARLQQPEEAYKLFKYFINHSTNEEIDYLNMPGSAGLYDNLLAAHSPFQVDGNMGFTAAVSEMLLQSHQGNWQDGYLIELLPALPKAWASGKVQGLKARGNITVDIEWQNGKLKNVILRSVEDKKCTVCYGEKKVVLELKKNKNKYLTNL